MAIDVRLIYTVLEGANRAKTKKEKVEILQRYNSQGLRDILACQYHDAIEFDLPEGAPPYDEFEAKKGETPNQLSKIGPKLMKYLIKGGPGKGRLPVWRERKFLDIIEVIHPNDAKVLIAAKDKKLKEMYPTITKGVVSTAFPQLLGNAP